jgi:hypothetical protein
LASCPEADAPAVGTWEEAAVGTRPKADVAIPDSPGRNDGRLDALTASGRIRVGTIPGTTHFLPIEQPELVRETLREVVELP